MHHPHSIKTLALTLTPLLALPLAALQAQTFTAPLQASTSGTNPVDFEFRADGTLIAKGNLGVGSLLSSDQGTGTRMLWFPSLAAFRAGTISPWYNNTNAWDQKKIGQGSVAIGENVVASGEACAAFGLNNIASGFICTAFGLNNLSSGSGSTAVGYQNMVTGDHAMGGGFANTAAGPQSTVFGQYNMATGSYAVALGYLNIASGAASLAVGSSTVASGSAAMSAGANTTAASLDCFAVGRYNVGGGNPNTWVATDPLFEIGNGPGTGATPKADALVVYKNGSAKFSGVVQVQPSADIPMYTGN